MEGGVPYDTKSTGIADSAGEFCVSNLGKGELIMLIWRIWDYRPTASLLERLGLGESQQSSGFRDAVVFTLDAKLSSKGCIERHLE